MIQKSTWNTPAVAAGWLAFSIGTNRRERSGEPGLPATTAPGKPLAIFLEISYSIRHGNVLHIMKQKDGKLSFTTNAHKRIIQARVFEIFSKMGLPENLTGFTAASKAADLGFSPPNRNIILKNGQNQSSRTKIGSRIPTQSGYCFQVDDGLPVIVGKGGMEKTVSLLSEDNLTLKSTNLPLW